MAQRLGCSRRGSTNIAVIGAGYVGLPLAVAFAEAGHAVLCVEPDAPRVARINAGDSYIKDVTVRDARASSSTRGLLRATVDYAAVAALRRHRSCACRRR